MIQLVMEFAQVYLFCLNLAIANAISDNKFIILTCRHCRRAMSITGPLLF